MSLVADRWMHVSNARGERLRGIGQSEKFSVNGFSSINSAIRYLGSGGIRDNGVGSDRIYHIDNRGNPEPYPEDLPPFPGRISRWMYNRRRILSRNEENVDSYFTYYGTPSDINGDVTVVNAPKSYAEDSTAKLKGLIKTNRDNLLWCKDISSISHTLDEGGFEGNKPLLSIYNDIMMNNETHTIEKTLDRLEDMKCVWVGIYLLLCDSPLTTRIRSLMGISDPKRDYMLPKKVRDFAPHTSNEARYARPEKLIAYLESELSKKEGVPVRCTDPLTTEQIAHIAYLLEIDIHIVDVDVYNRTMEDIDALQKDVEDETAKGDQFKDIIKFGEGKKPAIYFSAQGCIVQRKNDGKYRASIVFKRSKSLYKYGHLEPEYNMDMTVSLSRAVIEAGLFSSIDLYVRGEQGMKHKTVSHLDGDGLKKTEPLYVGSETLFTTAGFKSTTCTEINTIIELRSFVNRLVKYRKGTGPVPDELEKDIIYIGECAYEEEYLVNRRTNLQRMLQEDDPLYINDVVPLNGSKEVLDAILCSPDVEGASCPKTSCMLDQSKSLMDIHYKAVAAERLRAGQIQVGMMEGQEELVLQCLEEDGVREPTDVRYINSLSEFSINIVGRQIPVKVLFRGSPNTMVSDAIVESYLGGGVHKKSLLVTHQNSLGAEVLDVLNKELTRLKSINIRNTFGSKIKYIKERIKNVKNKPEWLKRDIKMVDPIFGTVVLDEFKGNGKRMSGVTVMDRVRIYDAPDVTDGKSVNASAWNQSFAANSTDGRDLFRDPKPKYEFDLKQAYPMALQGAYNTAFPLDINKTYPTHFVPNNPSLQPIDSAIVSYISGIGAININKNEVDIRALEKFAPIHFKHGSMLRQYIGTDGGPEVVSHTMLIAWTMDVWDEYVKGGGTDDFYTVANTFQMDILHIKTGRFAFSWDMRMSLDMRLKGRVFRDYGCAFLESEPVYKNVCDVFKHVLVVPNNCRILKRDKDKRDEIIINPDCFRGVPRNTILHNAIVGTCAVMVLTARAMCSVSALIGFELKNGDVVKRSDTKMVQNSSVGATRQSRTKGYDIQTESDMMDKNAIVNGDVSVNKLNPNQHVSMTILPRSKKCIIEVADVQSRQVRGSAEGIRDYAVTMATRAIEVLAIHCKKGNGALRIKVDSILLEGEEAAKDMEIRIKKLTDSPDGVVLKKSGLPGDVNMYSITKYEVNEFEVDSKMERVRKGDLGITQRVAGICDGIASIQYPTSEYKKMLDEDVWKVTRATEVLQEYYNSTDGFKDVFEETPTVSELESFMFEDVEEDMVVVQNKFKDGFHAYELNKLIEMDSFLMLGSPGTGKSYIAYELAKHYIGKVDIDKKEYGNTVRLIASFWRIAVASAGKVPIYGTIHGHIGAGVNVADAKRNPINYLKRTTKRYAGVAPYKEPCELTIADEIGASPVEFEEGLMASKIVGGRHIFVTDKYQSGAVVGAGIQPDGSIIKWAAEGKMYIKDIEYRNRDPAYLNAREETRRGNALAYYGDGLCDYRDEYDAESSIRDVLEEMAEEWVRLGSCSTTLVTQNYNVQGLLIMTILRLACMKDIEYDCVLSHIGGGVESGSNDEVQTETDDACVRESKAIYFGYNNESNTNAHKQKLRGVPLIFVPGSKWAVIKSFSSHLKNVKDKSVNKVQLVQSSILTYKRSTLYSCAMTRPKNAKVLKHGEYDPYSEIGSTRPVLFLEFVTSNGHKVKLTEYEAATYLFYPFMAQRVSLIGLTLDKVVLVQVATSFGYRGGYNRTYNPLKYQLDEIHEEYGKYSYVTDLCRQLQVLVTRVETGRTMMIDWHPNEDYKRLNYNAMTGATCGGYLAMYTEEARVEFEKPSGYIKNHNKKVRQAIQYRGCSIDILHECPQPETWKDMTSHALLGFRIEAMDPIDDKGLFMGCIIDKDTSKRKDGYDSDNIFEEPLEWRMTRAEMEADEKKHYGRK